MPARRREPLARDLPAEFQVASTNGSILTDSRGRKYIDFVMGWCVGNFGWRPAAIAKAIERFKGPDYVYPGYAYAPWTELARLLASLAPRPLTTCFRATGGSEAVDLALQAAMIHTGRRTLLSLEDGYHGNSLAGLSIGASDNRERIKNLLPHCDKIAPPLDAKALRRIEQRLKRRDIAAFVMEPISINLGVLILRCWQRTAAFSRWSAHWDPWPRNRRKPQSIWCDIRHLPASRPDAHLWSSR